MKRADFHAAAEPIVRAFVKALAEVTFAHYSDARERASKRVAEMFLAEIDQPSPTRAKPVKRKPRAAKADAVPANPPLPPPPVPTSPPTARKRALMRCSKCGAEGFRADGCGRTHNVGSAQPTPSSDDAEEEPRARRGRTPRSLAPAEEHVISHVSLVSMLAADRAQNDVGDAGGYLQREDRTPSLIGPTDETRELCPVHGWVGRFAFDRDQHELCMPVGEACTSCEGRKICGAKFCTRCEGTGIEPIHIAPAVPMEEVRPLAAAHVKVEMTAGRDGRRGHRRRVAPRSKTLALKRITKAVLREGALLYPPSEEQRPRTRGDCAGGARPCPWVACTQHLYLEVNPETGSIKVNFPDVEPAELLESCALDLADRGGLTLEDTGNLLNLTHERVRQIEVGGLLKLRASPVVAELGGEPFVADRREEVA